MKSDFFCNVVSVRHIPVRVSVVGCALGILSCFGGLPAVSAAPFSPAQPKAAEKPVANKPVATPVQRTPASGYREYLMGTGDVLDITVSNHPDLSASITVRPDGRITLPQAGEFTVKGKTSKALAREIENRLAVNYNNAKVTVMIKEAHNSQARVIGAVNAAGAFSLRPGWRVMDLVAAAGGLSTKTNRISGRIVRAGRSIPLDIIRANSFPLSNANVVLRPDDLVVLDAQNFVRQISVAGSVTRPGAYDMEEGLTVTSLLAQAGGPTPTASLRGAHVLRNGKQISLNLTSETGNDSTASQVTFVFQPGDVLVIPENLTRFGVLGQVAHPAYFPVPEVDTEATLLKVLALAGGPTADSDLAKITVTRSENGASKVITVDVSAMLKGTAPDTFQVKPDDVVFVPKKDDQVHIIGQVGRPGAFPLRDGMNPITLISEAGNLGSGASLSKTYVLRDGKQLPLDLRGMLIEGRFDPLVAGFKFQAGDTLVVPNTTDQITVSGQVAKPGAYSLDDDLNIVSLLTKAGNPLPEASLSRAYVIRKGEKLFMDLRSIGRGEANPVLMAFQFEPGDVLVLPENAAKYGVLGAVAKPGYYPYPEIATEATILKVLGNVGGAQNANMGGAGIIRKINGKQSVVPVNLKHVLSKGDKADMVLQPEDVLYIPEKGEKQDWLRILGSASMLTRF